MMKKFILACLLLPLIASCAPKAADYGLSEDEFNARRKQFDSICKGEEYRCRRPTSNNAPIFDFGYFLDNYDRYNKYPLDILRRALVASEAGSPQGLTDRDVNANLLYISEAISKQAAEEKIKIDKRIAEEEKKAEEKAKEQARLSKKYNKPWCYRDDLSIFNPESAPYKNCLVRLYPNERYIVVWQTHNGTFMGLPRSSTHHHHHHHYPISLSNNATVAFIERNSLDSSLPLGSYVPAGIFEFTGRYQNAETKVKRLE